METTIDTIEYNGEDVDVMITWDVIQCECTSEYGNSSVTERWEEAEALEARLMKDGITQIIHYFSDEPTMPFDKAVVKALESGELSY